MIDVTKDDIIKALVSQLTNLVLEQRENEVQASPEDLELEDEEVSTFCQNVNFLKGM